MGRIRDNNIKKLAREVVEKYPEQVSLNFDDNKKLLRKKYDIYGKTTRNRIAGYIIRVLKTKDNTYEHIKKDIMAKRQKRRKGKNYERQVKEV